MRILYRERKIESGWVREWERRDVHVGFFLIQLLSFLRTFLPSFLFIFEQRFTHAFIHTSELLITDVTIFFVRLWECLPQADTAPLLLNDFSSYLDIVPRQGHELSACDGRGGYLFLNWTLSQRCPDALLQTLIPIPITPAVTITWKITVATAHSTPTEPWCYWYRLWCCCAIFFHRGKLLIWQP